MNLQLLLAVSVTSFIWLLIVFYTYYRHKKELKAIVTDYNSKIESLMNNKQAELKESYEKGVLSAELRKDFAVVVRPWREETENSTFWKNKKTVKVGYSHQLYSNGIPCLDPYIIVEEEISVEKFNKENLDAALQRIDVLIYTFNYAKHPTVQVLSSATSLLLNHSKQEAVN